MVLREMHCFVNIVERANYRTKKLVSTTIGSDMHTLIHNIQCAFHIYSSVIVIGDDVYTVAAPGPFTRADRRI